MILTVCLWQVFCCQCGHSFRKWCYKSSNQRVDSLSLEDLLVCSNTWTVLIARWVFSDTWCIIIMYQLWHNCVSPHHHMCLSCVSVSKWIVKKWCVILRVKQGERMGHLTAHMRGDVEEQIHSHLNSRDLSEACLFSLYLCFFRVLHFPSMQSCPKHWKV